MAELRTTSFLFARVIVTKRDRERTSERLIQVAGRAGEVGRIFRIRNRPRNRSPRSQSQPRTLTVKLNMRDKRWYRV